MLNPFDTSIISAGTEIIGYCICRKKKLEDETIDNRTCNN